MLAYADEIKYLAKYTILIDIILCTLLYICNEFTKEAFLGVLVGVIVVIVNFIVIVITSINSLKKSPKVAAKKMFLSYILRYILIFGIIATCFSSNVINPWYIMLNLIYPKIIFSFKILLGKE